MIKMALYQNKYRIESARLKNWNYCNAGAYFITICTENRLCYFGECNQGKMLLNGLGGVIKTEWKKTIALRPDMNLALGEFVVMPNHFHGIVIIGENEFNTNMAAMTMTMVETQCIAPLQPPSPSSSPSTSQNSFGPQRKNLSSIIRGFKSACTKQIRIQFPETHFRWQSRFHDHIIRNDKEYARIENYIISNPANWNADTFYPEKPSEGK